MRGMITSEIDKRYFSVRYASLNLKINVVAHETTYGIKKMYVIR